VARPRRDRAPLRVLTTTGVQVVSHLSDRDASAVGRHWNAVRRYLDFGEDNDLADFDGEDVAGHELETRLDAIEWHAIRGEIRFEDIYEEVD
jgi:hypothetical protein